MGPTAQPTTYCLLSEIQPLYLDDGVSLNPPRFATCKTRLALLLNYGWSHTAYHLLVWLLKLNPSKWLMSLLTLPDVQHVD